MNITVKIIAACIGLYLGLSTKLNAQNTGPLEQFVRSENLKHAGIGIKVIDLSTGKTICSHNENLALVPASTLKLVTTATALELLGEKYTYQTRLEYEGNINSRGELSGNLYIAGSGDPTLGSEYTGEDKEAFLKIWLASIQKSGIRSISGNVIALDNLFGYEGISPQWTWEDIGNYYASGTYGISIFDNTYRLYLKSGSTGSQPVILRTEPTIPGLTVENHLKAASNNLDSAYIYGIPFSYERRIYGTIPQNRTSFIIKGDIPDPGLFLASYITDFLIKNGINVNGKPTTYRIFPQKPEKTTTLTTFLSVPLTDIIRIINTKSNNHYAEHIFQTLIQVKKQSINDHWKNKGLDTEGLFMQDGCGLSPANAVSAGFLTDLLFYMNKKSKYGKAFYYSLPLAGKEGTVTSFLKETPLEGKARVKSGSIRNVQSYAGYIEKGDKQYAFSIIVNHYTGKRTVLKTQIEELLTALF